MEELNSRISTIRNSEEYKRLNTKSRGKNDQHRFNNLNAHLKVLERQRSEMAKSGTISQLNPTEATRPEIKENITPSEIQSEALVFEMLNARAAQLEEADRVRKIRLGMQSDF